MLNARKHALSQWFRTRRDALLRQCIAACPRRTEHLEILDVGGDRTYWERVGIDFLQAQSVRVTLLNLRESSLGEHQTSDLGVFTYVIGDGRQLDFPDHAFDLCHSNSVIEHVGLWADVEAFARETRRVARAYYVQTPNFWFPIEPHFASMPMIHWLPRPLRAGLMRRFALATAGRARSLGKAYEYVDSARLLTRGQMRYLFPDSELHAERFLLAAKSFIAIRTNDAPPHNGAITN